MTNLTHHITKREVPFVIKALHDAGYTSTGVNPYTFVCNLSNNLEPMDLAARRRVETTISIGIENAHIGGMR